MELEHLNRYPNFKDIVELVVNKSHLQKSKILNFHKRVDKTYFEKAENFSQKMWSHVVSDHTRPHFLPLEGKSVAMWSETTFQRPPPP